MAGPYQGGVNITGVSGAQDGAQKNAQAMQRLAQNAGQLAGAGAQAGAGMMAGPNIQASAGQYQAGGAGQFQANAGQYQAASPAQFQANAGQPAQYQANAGQYQAGGAGQFQAGGAGQYQAGAGQFQAGAGQFQAGAPGQSFNITASGAQPVSAGYGAAGQNFQAGIGMGAQAGNLYANPQISGANIAGVSGAQHAQQLNAESIQRALNQGGQ